MKKLYKSSLLACAILMCACSKETDYVEVKSAEDLPQVIYFDDEGDGDIEDADEVKIKLALVERVDPSGEEIAGKAIPLNNPATVFFQLSGAEGFTNLSDYILEVEAIYEIDDCTEGEIKNVSIDLSTGIGSVEFPADVEEIEIVLVVDEDLFDDDEFNDASRGFVAQLTSVTSKDDVAVNTDLEFEYTVLDDEAVFGAWELDHEDSTQLARFMALFGLVNEDVAALKMEEIDGIEMEFKYDELSVVVKLVEEELIEECGESEMDNIEIEIEMDYDDLTDDALEGDASFEGEVELEDGSIGEYTYEGSFSIEDGKITLTLAGEYDDESTEELELTLEK